MDKILWEDLKNNQKIKALDSIYILADGSINLSESDEVYITGNQIENKMLIANAGDIGTWDKDDQQLYFDMENEDDGEINNIKHGIDFSENCSCGLWFDNDVFELVEDE